MGLLGECFGAGKAPAAPSPPSGPTLAISLGPASPAKEKRPDIHGRQTATQQLLFPSGADAVAVLNVSGERDCAASALRFCQPSSSSSQDVPRVTCRLSAASRPLPGPGWELRLPDAWQDRASMGPWLHAEPVAVNDGACAAWGMWDLQPLAQALAAFVVCHSSLLSAMSEVAMCLAAPWEVLQALRTPSQPLSRSCSLPGGGSVTVSSSYIRDPRDGTLSPALVLEMAGVSFNPRAPTLTRNPQPPNTSPWPPSLPDATGQASGRSVIPGQSQHSVASSGGEQRGLRTAAELYHSKTGSQSLWELAASTATKDVHSRAQREKAKNELLRAKSMLCAVPCIATLLHLQSVSTDLTQSASHSHSYSLEDVQGPSTSGRVTGQVLMQNAQSMAYWGKLTSKKGPSGVEDMFALLFNDDPDAITRLHQLQVQPPSPQSDSVDGDGSWKTVVQVPPRRHHRRHKQAEQAAGEGGRKGSEDTGSVDELDCMGRDAARRRLAGLADPPGAQGGGVVAAAGTSGRGRVSSGSPRESAAAAATQPEMDAQRRSLVNQDGSVSQGLSSSWMSSTSRLSHSTGDRRRTSPSGRFTPIDLHSQALPGSGRVQKSSSPLEMIMGSELDHLDEAYMTEPVDEEGSGNPYEGAMPGTVESFAPSLFSRTSQPVLQERSSNAMKRLSSSMARGSNASLSFPQLPEVNPPSVSTRVMKLSMLTAAGASASGQHATGTFDLRQRSHIELHQNSFSPGGAGRRIASMSCVDHSAVQGLRSMQAVPQQPTKAKGSSGIRSTILAPPGRTSAAGPASSSRLQGASFLQQQSWPRSHLPGEGGADDQCSSQVTSPSTDRDKLSPMTPYARLQYAEPLVVNSPRRVVSMDVADLSANGAHNRRLQASMSVGDAPRAARDLREQQLRRRHDASHRPEQEPPQPPPSQSSLIHIQSQHQNQHQHHLHHLGGGLMSPGNGFYSIASAGDGLEDEEAGVSSSMLPTSEANMWSEGEGSEAGEEGHEVEELTHEVQAIRVIDPVTGKPAILLLQTDITARALMEKRMSALTETQLTMLENMLPRQLLEYAIGGAGPIGSLAYQHDEVTVLFMDIVGFTSMSKNVEPHLVMGFLNNLFSTLDAMCETFNVYKVDTAGDCYIVAGALMTVDEDGFIALDEDADPREGARNVVAFAEEIMDHVQTVYMPHDGRPTSIRVGIHTGSVVSGLVGTKMFKFSLFGDTMNTSSRMESTSRPGCIQISSVTYDILDDDQRALFNPTGGVEVKGKGLMATYIYQPDKARHSDDGQLVAIDEESQEVQSDLNSGEYSKARSFAIASAPTCLMECMEPGDALPGDALPGPGPMTLNGGRESKSRRRSTESPSHPVSRDSSVGGGGGGVGTNASTTPTGKGGSGGVGNYHARRSSFAAYGAAAGSGAGTSGGGTARRPEHVVAEMFRAAAAVMEQQQQHHLQQQAPRDGVFVKLMQCNVKSMPK